MRPVRGRSFALVSILSISLACQTESATGGDGANSTGENDGSGGDGGGAGGVARDGGRTAGDGMGGAWGGGGMGGGGAGGIAGGGTDAGGAAGMVSVQGSFCPMPASSYNLRLPADPTATLVKGGLRGAEGPVWVAEQKALFFSEIHRTARNPVNWKDPQFVTIQKYTPADDMLTEWIPAAGTNGMAVIKLAGKTQLITANLALQGLALYDLTTKAKTDYATMFMDKTFKATNDLAVSARGDVFFSDPVWHETKVATTMPTEGVYRIAPNKTVTLIDDTFRNPNGVSLSPDDRILYVAGNAPRSMDPAVPTPPGLVKSYPVGADGSVGPGSTFVIPKAAGADGMAIDCAGNVYVTVDNGVEVYAPDKTFLGLIKVPMPHVDASNAAFGGPDGKTLYITSEPFLTPTNRAIFKIDLNIPGIPF